jgi:sigma-B regulation protein RsbU (phosphoserine phosphatase)
VAATPRSEYDFAGQFSSDTAVSVRVSELIRLQKSAQRITSTLDLDEIVQRLAQEVSDSLSAVEINLYLREPEQNGLVLAGMCGCTMYCRGHRLKEGAGMVGHVAATRKLHYAPDVHLDPYYMACEPGTNSEVAIPLEVDGELVGVFSASHRDRDAFCSTQLRLLQGLCSHVAVAVHNARRFHREHKQREQLTREAEEARIIQQALLPRTSPLIPGFVVSGLSLPAGAVGGDWYDFIPLTQGRWGLVLADVSGKGTAAALLMSATRGMLRSLAQVSSGPGEVLTRLNNMLLEDFPDGRFVTMVYAELDPQKHSLRLANAGHLAPLLVEGSEPFSYRWIQSDQGLPLGITTSKFSETEIQLNPGSRLAFYSDGITEAELDSGEEYGSERLLEQMRSASFSPESLLADVKKFSNGTGLRDDATVILVRRRDEIHQT